MPTKLSLIWNPRNFKPTKINESTVSSLWEDPVWRWTSTSKGTCVPVWLSCFHRQRHVRYEDWYRYIHVTLSGTNPSAQSMASGRVVFVLFLQHRPGTRGKITILTSTPDATMFSMKKIQAWYTFLFFIYNHAFICKIN